MGMREGIRFVECNLAGVATIPALEIQDSAWSYVKFEYKLN